MPIGTESGTVGLGLWARLGLGIPVGHDRKILSPRHSRCIFGSSCSIRSPCVSSVLIERFVARSRCNLRLSFARVARLLYYKLIFSNGVVVKQNTRVTHKKFCCDTTMTDASVFLLIAVIVVSVLIMVAVIFLMVYYGHPDDQNENYLPKFIVVSAISRCNGIYCI